MQIRKAALSLLILMPCLVFADDAARSDTSTDTFGKLLAKQAELLGSEMDAKIRQNQNQAIAGGGGVNPLPGIKQEVNDQEPIVEAIWGLEGKEVAEIIYKGGRLPVSMQEPFISKVDGWKLESIEPYMIKMVQLGAKGNVVRRKTIMLDFLGGENAATRVAPDVTAPSISFPQSPITPAITSPLIR